MGPVAHVGEAPRVAALVRCACVVKRAMCCEGQLQRALARHSGGDRALLDFGLVVAARRGAKKIGHGPDRDA